MLQDHDKNHDADMHERRNSFDDHRHPFPSPSSLSSSPTNNQKVRIEDNVSIQMTHIKQSINKSFSLIVQGRVALKREADVSMVCAEFIIRVKNLFYGSCFE